MALHTPTYFGNPPFNNINFSHSNIYTQAHLMGKSRSLSCFFLSEKGKTLYMCEDYEELRYTRFSLFLAALKMRKMYRLNFPLFNWELLFFLSFRHETPLILPYMPPTQHLIAAHLHPPPCGNIAFTQSFCLFSHLSSAFLQKTRCENMIIGKENLSTDLIWYFWHLFKKKSFEFKLIE